MAKPKSVIFPRAVKQTETQETTVLQNDTVMEKLNKHIDNKDIHIDTHTRDSISYMRKDIDNHIYNDAHITDAERATWNSKETVAGSQSKANKVMNSLEAHRNDLSVHITKQEKTLLKDKYTKAEVRNLLKHALTGLNFLPSVSVFGDLAIKYPNPKFNSCAKVRSNSKSYIYNGNEWIEFDIEKLLTPEATIELDGLMSKEDKIKLDTIEEYANNYIHPDDIDTRHVSDEQISRWDNKAEGKLVSILTDGLMSKEDKIKLDTIEDSANYYIHPETHSAVMIEEDETHRFITDEERANWDNKPNKDYVDNEVAKTLLSAKSFTDSKVAAMFNTSADLLEVLRTLSFELKKDEVVSSFMNRINDCAKTAEFNDHVLNSNIHMNKKDINLLHEVKTILESGLNPDFNETDTTSIKYIENKPKALPANGGNSDTVGGYRAEDLFSNKNFYDYTLGTNEYSNEQVSVIVDDKTIDTVIDNINRKLVYTILFKPGEYSINKELVIKASNIIINGIGAASKLLGTSIRIIGNNNTIENINLVGDKDKKDVTAIYVEGNNNIIKNNTISNYNNGIMIEGSNNTVINNYLFNFTNNAISLSADYNTNFGNIIESNRINKSYKGISLVSSENSLIRNHIVKNEVLGSKIGIYLSNTKFDSLKTTANIINENIVVKGKGLESEYLPGDRTIFSDFSSKNIISSNITSGKEIIAPSNILSNNLF